MNKFTLSLKISLLLSSGLVFSAFAASLLRDEQTAFLQKKLTEHYDQDQGGQQVKRYELNVTNSGFCRYKRFFNNGKVEYFSFNLMKFKALDYYGTDKSGKLYLSTKGDDVIVQTYNDRKGKDIDSMAAYMVIPLKNIEPQDLLELNEGMLKMNALLVSPK